MSLICSTNKLLMLITIKSTVLKLMLKYNKELHSKVGRILKINLNMEITEKWKI